MHMSRVLDSIADRTMPEPNHRMKENLRLLFAAVGVSQQTSKDLAVNRLNAVSAYMRKMDHYGHSDF